MIIELFRRYCRVQLVILKRANLMFFTPLEDMMFSQSALKLQCEAKK
jgi:hypothetical protein